MVNNTAKTRQIAAHTQPAMAYVKLPCSTAMTQFRPCRQRMCDIHSPSDTGRYHII